MESNDKLNKLILKFVQIIISSNIIKIENFDLDNILIDEKSSGNILVYDISYKTLIGAKPLRIRPNKVDGFIRVYDETRYLVLLGGEKYDFIYNKTFDLIGAKSDITYVIFHNYPKINVDLYDSLPVEKALS